VTGANWQFDPTYLEYTDRIVVIQTDLVRMGHTVVCVRATVAEIWTMLTQKKEAKAETAKTQTKN
jgi:hypothetical protein